MELRRYLNILRRRIALIGVTLVVALGVAWATTPRTSTYSASATIYVGARQFSVVADRPLSNDVLTGVERITATFARMIDSEPIAVDALQRTGVARSAPSLVDATAALPIPGTQLLAVVVTDEDPTVARDLANAMAEAFVEKVQTFEPGQPAGEGTLPALPAYIFEKAKLPTVPIPDDLTQKLVIAGVFGFLASAGLAFLLEYLDITIKNTEDAERRLALPVLGVIPMHAQQPVEKSRLESVISGPPRA